MLGGVLWHRSARPTRAMEGSEERAGVAALQMESAGARSQWLKSPASDWSQPHSDTYCTVRGANVKATAVALPSRGAALSEVARELLPSSALPRFSQGKG